MDALVVSKISGCDMEQVIGFTCHQVTLPNIRTFPDAGFKTTEGFVCQAFKRDLYDNGGQLVS